MFLYIFVSKVSRTDYQKCSTNKTCLYHPLLYNKINNYFNN